MPGESVKLRSARSYLRKSHQKRAPCCSSLDHSIESDENVLVKIKCSYISLSSFSKIMKIIRE